MLTSLHIENIAVIKELDIDLEDGLNVLTGETGAGKSILIDSINFLLGSRAGKEMIRSGEEKASVSALFTGISDATRTMLFENGFDADSDEIMLLRSLTKEGRTTAKLNGRSITGAMLREIGKTLINIHGQNDNQALMQKSSHVKILDTYADTELSRYLTVYEEMQGVKKRIEAASFDESEKMRTLEMLRYQINDIESVGPKENEEEKLEAERTRLANIEKITKNARYVYLALKGSEKRESALQLIEKSAAALEQLGGIIPEAEEYAKKLTEFRYEIDDIAEAAYDIASDSDTDPTARLDKIEARLDALTKLKRKYGPTIADVLEFEKKAKEKFEELESSDEQIAKLERKYALLEAEARELAGEISTRRIEAAKGLVGSITETLEFLDMPKVRFFVSVEPKKDAEGKYIYERNGYDDVEFLISTNPGEPLQSMIKIASGGELSRIMLAIKSVISDKDGVDTIIFDEIDTGVSGKTSRKIGIKLRQMSKALQVICVTHSAQIASAANTHMYISKQEEHGRAITGVSVLSGEDRVDEIARIIGGIDITDLGRAAAREMILEAENF